MINNNKYKSDSQLSLVSLAVPFIIMMFAQFITPIINTFILVAVPGNGPIYAESVGVASQIYTMFSILLTFVSGGVGVIIGQLIGKKTSEGDIQTAINTCILVTFLMSLSIVIIAEVALPFILYGYVDSSTIQYENAVIYGETLTIAILITSVKIIFTVAISAYGYIKHTIICNVLGIVIDILLTYLFVLQADMGVLGSSLGTIIASIVALVYAFIAFNKFVYKLHWKQLKIKKEICIKLLKISVPVGIEKLNYNFAMLVIGLLVAQIGFRNPDAFIITSGNSKTNLLNLSHTMIQTFIGVITLTSLSFSAAAQIIVSRKMGAKDYAGARKVIRDAFFISLVCDMILATILFFLRTYIVDLFTYTNVNVAAAKDQIIKIVFAPFIIVIIIQMGKCMNLVFLVGPMAYGNLIMNSLFSIGCTWLLIASWGIIALTQSNGIETSFLYGINGIYLLFAIDGVSRGVFNILWWRSGKWRQPPNFSLLNRKSTIYIVDDSKPPLEKTFDAIIE